MTPIKMVALALEDTLLRTDGIISFRTRNTIKRVTAAGIGVALVSRQSPFVMERYSRFLGLRRQSGYLIGNSGGLIRESNTGTLVYEKRIPTEAALIAFDLASAEGFAIQLYENDTLYVSRATEFTHYDEKITGVRQVVADNFRALVSAGCYKLIIPGDPMILPPLESLLRTYMGEDIAILAGTPYFLEILPAGADTGTALDRTRERLGIPREAVLALGASPHDEAMLQAAGVPAAMVNGDRRLMEMAALVTEKSNDEDGAADFLERYLKL